MKWEYLANKYHINSTVSSELIYSISNITLEVNISSNLQDKSTRHIAISIAMLTSNSYSVHVNLFSFF